MQLYSLHHSLAHSLTYPIDDEGVVPRLHLHSRGDRAKCRASKAEECHFRRMLYREDLSIAQYSSGMESSGMD